jgi:hypothetical protein
MKECRSKSALLFALLVAAWAAPAFGKEYSDPAGFSLTYPDGWIAVPAPAGDGFNPKDFPPEIQKWIAKNDIKVKKVALVVIRDGPEEFLENLNVVVEERQIPVDDKSAKKLSADLSQVLQSAGATIKSQQANVQKIGNRDVIVLDFESTFPVVPFPMKQRQVVFVGGGKTYVVTCTTKAADFAQHAKTFEIILASVNVPDPAPQGINWRHPAVMGAIVGGIAGAIGVTIAALAKLRRPKKRRSYANEQPDEFEE